MNRRGFLRLGLGAAAVMRSHSSMSDDNKSREKTYLAIGGF